MAERGSLKAANHIILKFQQSVKGKQKDSTDAVARLSAPPGRVPARAAVTAAAPGDVDER